MASLRCVSSVRQHSKRHALNLLCPARRTFSATQQYNVIKPFLLADIGEGIRECQIIQWFVQPGARVEQFDKLCEVQSDKAATDITSPFDGVVRKLFYEPDDMALVGKPLLEIDIQSDITPEDEAQLGDTAIEATRTTEGATPQDTAAPVELPRDNPSSADAPMEGGKASNTKLLATPAVRHLLRQRNLDIASITGTGRDGRVTKEDVQRHIEKATTVITSATGPTPRPADGAKTRKALSPVQMAMFKTMTRSLSIPHFLYSIEIDMTSMSEVRKRANSRRVHDERLTPLAFIVKAISLALTHHPLLNAALDTTQPSGKPELVFNACHDFGIAVDTPSGLLVPVIRGIDSRSVISVAAELRRIGTLARTGKLQSSDSEGATFTISNIGSIGGGVVSPIIVEPQVAIVGIGRSKRMPTFDETGAVVPREQMVLSWSADHRVLDGAECARAAEKVKQYLEAPQDWLLEMV